MTYAKCLILIGGSAWESNPPGTVLAPHTGFEVREAHQRPWHFHERVCFLYTIKDTPARQSVPVNCR